MIEELLEFLVPFVAITAIFYFIHCYIWDTGIFKVWKAKEKTSERDSSKED